MKAEHKEFGMTKEEMVAVLEPERYTGRCAEQVEQFLQVVAPYIADVSGESPEINL